jgi:glycosyltransferase involved in cell wall biosynthesis
LDPKERKVRVLHIIARFNVGGTATWISNLSESLIKDGHENFLIFGAVQKGETEDQRFHKIGGVRLENLGRRVAILSDFLALLQIRKFIKEVKPDVINTHTAKAGALGRFANLSLGKNRVALVHTIHGHLLVGYFPKLIVKIISQIESILSYATDVMLFAGEKVKEDSIKAGVRGQRATRVVMPGLPIMQPKREVHNGVIIGWLARFASVKRPDRVIEIARQLPDLHFAMGGDGPLREESIKKAPKNVSFVGWQNPEVFWSKCDLALLTSENEALPISLIEAQLQGLPSVTTPAGSAPEVVLDGVNGFVAPSFRVDDLVSAIKRLSEDASLAREFGDAARVRAEQTFSLKKQLADHLVAYQLAIDLRKSRRR